jgi:hypothetical protein
MSEEKSWQFNNGKIKVIPVTWEEYQKLFLAGKIDETAFYKIIDEVEDEPQS